jgi:ribosomal protein S12 methylthiotransferase accessory factor
VVTERDSRAGSGKLDLGGTLRARPVEETLETARRHLARIGVTRVADVTGLDDLGIPVIQCVRPDGRSLSVSQGKGLTRDLAEASAIHEALESFHAEHLAPDHRATVRELRTRRPIVDPRRLTRPSVGHPFDPDREIAWVSGRDVATGETVEVPHVFLSLDFRAPHPDGCFVEMTSTGLAAGNRPDEAIAHALYEVVERHSLWEARQREDPELRRSKRLDLRTVDTPASREVLERLRLAEARPVVWDITGRTGLPAYACTLSRAPRLSRGLTRFGGFGCHAVKDIALVRSLLEAVQSRVTVISGTRDDLSAHRYAVLGGGDDGEGTLDYRERASAPTGATFAEDVALALRRLAEAGFDRVVAVDHTRPEIGAPVFRVVVPGMETAAP